MPTEATLPAEGFSRGAADPGVLSKPAPDISPDEVWTMVSSDDRFKSMPPEQRGQTLDDALTHAFSHVASQPDFNADTFKSFSAFADRARAKAAPSLGEKTMGAVKGAGGALVDLGKGFAADAAAVAEIPFTPFSQESRDIVKTGLGSMGWNAVDWLRAAGDALPNAASRTLNKSVDAFKEKLKNGELYDADPDKMMAKVKAEDEKLRPLQTAFHGEKNAKAHGLMSPQNAHLIALYHATHNPAYLGAIGKDLTISSGQQSMANAREKILAEPGAQAFKKYGDNAPEALLGGTDPLNFAFVASNLGKRAVAGSLLTRVAKFTGHNAAFATAMALRQNPKAPLSDIGEETIKLLLMGGAIKGASALASRLMAKKNVAEKVPRGIVSGTNEPPQNQFLSGVHQEPETGTMDVHQVSREIPSSVEGGESANAGTTQETERAPLRTGVSSSGQTETGAVPEVRGTSADASPGLQQAASGGMVLPEASFGTASGNESGITAGTPSREAYTGQADATAPAEPSLPVRPPGQPGTSINHADTDAIRAKMGLAPEDRSGRVPTNEEAATKAQAMLAADSSVAHSTHQFHVENPDSRIGKVDEWLVFHWQKHLESEWDSALRALDATPETSPDRAARQDAFDLADKNLQESLDMTSRAGSAWSEEGQARQRRAKERRSSLPMTLKVLEATTGKPVEKEQRDSITKAFDEKQAAEKASTAAVEKAQTNAADETQSIIGDLKKTTIASRLKKRATPATRRQALETLVRPPKVAVPESKPVEKTPSAKLPTTRKSPQRSKNEKAAREEADAAVESMAQDMRSELSPGDSRGAQMTGDERDQRLTEDEHQQALDREAQQKQTHWEQVYKDALNRAEAENPSPDANLYMHNPLSLAANILTTMARQARDLASFTRAALARFGAWIKPHLQAIWNSAKTKVEDAVMRYLQKIGAIKFMDAEGRPRGISPEDAQAGVWHYANIADKHHGSVQYPMWSDAMHGDGRSLARSRSHFDAAKAAYEAHLDSIVEAENAPQTPMEVKEEFRGEDMDSLVPVARKLFKAHINADESLHADTPENTARLTKLVQADLADLGQNLTESETNAAISDYGPKPEPKRTPAQIAIRNHQAAILNLKKQESAEAGKLPWIRRLFSRATDRMRRAEQELRDKIRNIQDEEVKAGRMKSEQDRIIAALDNQIRDLQAEINGTRQERGPRDPVTYTQQMNDLVSKRDALREAVRKQRDPNGDIEYNKRLTAAAKASEEGYNRRLARAEFARKQDPANHAKTQATQDAQDAAKRAKEAFDDAADASGQRAIERLERTLKSLHLRAVALQQEINSGTKPGRSGKPENLWGSEQFRAERAELARLKAVIKEKRTETAKTAGEAAASLLRSLDNQIARLDAAIRGGKAPQALISERAALAAHRAELDFPALQKFKSLQDARTARADARRAEIERTGQLPAKKSRRQIELDDDAQKKQAAAVSADNKLQRAIKMAEWKAAPAWLRGLNHAANIVREGTISGYHTLAKIGGFSITRLAEAPFMEATGYLLSKFPGLRRIMGGARFERGGELASHLEALSAFYSNYFTKGMKEAWQQLRARESETRSLFDKPHPEPEFKYQIFGNIHAAEKTPLIVAHYEMNVKRLEGQGVPIIDAVRKEAYEHAKRSALQESNRFSKWVNESITKLEKPDKTTGKVSPYGAGVAAFLRIFVTKGIVKTPANYVVQTWERTPFSFLSSGARAAASHFQKGGVEGLHPIEKELLSRLMKAGLVGSAFFAWGALDALRDPSKRIFGGYYQPGKRDESDAKFGGMKIFGSNSKWWHILTHNPLTEVAQMGSTMVRVAMTRHSAKDPNQRGALAGAIASMMGLLEHAPVSGSVMELSKLHDANQDVDTINRALRGLIPQLIQNIAEDMDKNEHRKPKTLPQHLEMGIPMLRENVPVFSGRR